MSKYDCKYEIVNQLEYKVEDLMENKEQLLRDNLTDVRELIYALFVEKRDDRDLYEEIIDELIEGIEDRILYKGNESQNVRSFINEMDDRIESAMDSYLDSDDSDY